MCNSVKSTTSIKEAMKYTDRKWSAQPVNSRWIDYKSSNETC